MIGQDLWSTPMICIAGLMSVIGILPSASALADNIVLPRNPGVGDSAGTIAAGKACGILADQSVGGGTLTAIVVPSTATAPTFCKVSGLIAPALHFEMRIPDGWNGKIYYGGGGGHDGGIPALLLPPLIQDYAEVVSDSGHQGSEISAAFIVNDDLAAEFFGSRAVPTVMATAKEVLKMAYGNDLPPPGGPGMMLVQGWSEGPPVSPPSSE